MITFFNRLLAKGGSWIFTILLALIVVSFVFYVGNSPGITPKEQGLDDYSYYGINIIQGNPEWREVQQKAAILAEMENGSLLNNPQFAQFAPRIIAATAERYAFQNIPLSMMAEEMGLPEPTIDEIQDFIKDQSLFQNSPQGSFGRAGGPYSRDKLDNFLLRLESNGTRPLFDKAIRESLTLQHLRDVFSGPGRAIPFEAESKIRSDETRWSVELAVLERASGKDAPEIGEPKDEELKTLYEETKDEYIPAERRKVSYVVFKPEYPHPTTAQLKEYYAKHHKRYAEEEEKADDKEAKDDKEEKAPEEPKMIPYDELDYLTRMDVVEDYETDNNLVVPALKQAQAKADEILDIIYNDNNRLSREETNKVLDEQGLKVYSHLASFVEPVYPKKQLIEALNAPFIHQKPSDQENSEAEKLLKQAFSILTEDRYNSEAFRIGNNYVILFLDNIKAAEAPSFEDLKKNRGKWAQLRRVWSNQKKEEMFSKKREEIESAINKALEENKSLADSITSTDAGKGWILSHKAHENFKSSKLPEGLEQQVFDTVKDLSSNNTSDMLTVGSKAYLLVLKEKLVPSYSMKNQEVKDELNRMSRSAPDRISQELVKRGQDAMKINIFDPENNS